MTAPGWVALASAIFGAFSYGAGSILQAVGAGRSAGTVRTLGHPLYLLGVGCDLLAWAGSLVALRELAVYQVQSVLAGSLAVTVVAAWLFLSSRLRRRDVAAVAVTIGALTILAMSAGPQGHVEASTGLRIGFCVAALATALIGWCATKVASPGVVAALAGLSFGGSALSGRALMLPPAPAEHLAATALAIVTEPLVAALVTFAVTGMLLYTNALQHGQVGPVTAVLWVGEVVAPSAVGLALLGDTVRPGWDLASAIAGLVVVGAAVVLASAPATAATAQPSPEQPPEATLPAARSAGRWPSWVDLVWPDQFHYQPVKVQPASGGGAAGTTLWWGPPSNPQPIWVPPDRAEPILAEPVWSYPPAAQPASPAPARPQASRARTRRVRAVGTPRSRRRAPMDLETSSAGSSKWLVNAAGAAHRPPDNQPYQPILTSYPRQMLA